MHAFILHLYIQRKYKCLLFQCYCANIISNLCTIFYDGMILKSLMSIERSRGLSASHIRRSSLFSFPFQAIKKGNASSVLVWFLLSPWYHRTRIVTQSGKEIFMLSSWSALYFSCMPPTVTYHNFQILVFRYTVERETSMHLSIVMSRKRTSLKNETNFPWTMAVDYEELLYTLVRHNQ